MSSSRKRKRWCSRTSAVRAATACSWVACTLGCINAARRCGSLSPAHSACRMAHPDKPITELRTVDNLSPASSSTLWTLPASRVRSCTRLEEQTGQVPQILLLLAGRHPLALKSPCCVPRPQSIRRPAHPFFAPLTALICWALATTNSKKPILSSIHLQPIHSRALHAHMATLLLQQPGQPCQQIRCFIAERADLFASLSRLDTTQTHAPVSADARQCLRTVDTSPLYSCVPLLSLQCSSFLCAATSQAVSVLLQCILRALLCGSGRGGNMEWFVQTPQYSFPQHVGTQYSVGRLLSRTLPP